MKAVAIPYVIALILGIIVVAVIGYWFFVVAGGGGGQLSLTQCQAQFVAYCTQQAATGYSNFQNWQSTQCSSYISIGDGVIGNGDQTACQALLHQSSSSCTPPAPDASKLGCTSTQKITCVSGSWICQ